MSGPVVISLLLSACSAASDIAEPGSPPAASRTDWRLHHRVASNQRFQVIGYHLSPREESTYVRVAARAGDGSHDCFVTLAAAGEGGPDNRVGEQLKTAHAGRPAVRSGAGAEGTYLMWQLADQRWITVDCSDLGVDQDVDALAALVELKSSTVPIPVEMAVPEGLGVSSIEVRLDDVSQTHVYLGRTGGQSAAQADFEVYPVTVDWQPAPSGEPRTIAGRQVLENQDTTSPVVWVRAGDRWIYVGASAGDTGPYPDRSGDLPVIEALAGSVTAAADLDDPATWFDADEVFG